MPAVSFSDIAPTVSRLCSAKPSSAVPLTEGAYSQSGRWIVTLSDGSSVFVKAEDSTSEEHGLGLEHQVYSCVRAPFLPHEIGYETNGSIRVLVTEDLSSARWGIPLDDNDASMLGDALGQIGLVAPPAGLPALPVQRQWQHPIERIAAWGLASHAWLERHLPPLSEAAQRADPTGSQLVHADVFVQNWCRAERGAVLVDWAGCGIGNVMVSRAWGEAGVRAAGGPAGIVVEHGRAPEWAAWIAGQFVDNHLGHTMPAPERLAETERREAIAALAWACDELQIEHATHAPGFMPAGSWRP